MDAMQGVFQGFDISSSALRAEMHRAEVVSANIGNMHVTGGRTRDPYRRRTVVFEELMQQVQGPRSGIKGADKSAAGVRVAQVHEDRRSPFVPRYDPGDPEANDEGFVLTSNVDLFQELVEMNIIERSFEANLAAMRVYRNMVQNSVSAISRA